MPLLYLWRLFISSKSQVRPWLVSFCCNLKVFKLQLDLTLGRINAVQLQVFPGLLQGLWRVLNCLNTTLPFNLHAKNTFAST